MKKKFGVIGMVGLLGGFFSPDSCPADASFMFVNHYSLYPYVDAPIFDASGNPLAGSNFLADLVVGPSQDSLQPVYSLVVPHVLVTGLPFKTTTPGYILGESVVARSLVPGQVGWLQVRAWEAALGATYDEAVAQGLGGYGESPLFQGYGYIIVGQELGAPLFGLQSFTLRPVIPEPNVAWLLTFGVPWLFFLCRKSRSGRA